MRILQLVGSVLILFASPAMAKEAVAAWTVAQKSGEVRLLRSGMQPASVNLRAALAPGDIVATGANGRAMLTKGDDYVVVAPSSRLVLPKAQEQSGFTRLIQQMGTMLYKVKRTGVPHFEVETPMLAAVVKGTTFTVVVDQKGAAVQVTEGLVEVSSLTGNARRLVEGGLTVYVGRERPNEIIDVKPNTMALPGVADSGDAAVQIEGSGYVSLTTISNLTDGLVREAPVVKLASGNFVTTPNGLSAPAAPAPLAQLDLLADPVPVTDIVDTAVLDIAEPVLGAVETILPAVTEPVVDLVQTTLPAVTQPVVEIVQTTLPAITQPVVEIVQTTLPAVTQPVVEIVQTTLPAITQPVVEIVQTTVPVITQPVVEIVQTTVPVITQPVVDVVATVPNILCTLLCGR